MWYDTPMSMPDDYAYPHRRLEQIKIAGQTFDGSKNGKLRGEYKSERVQFQVQSMCYSSLFLVSPFYLGPLTIHHPGLFSLSDLIPPCIPLRKPFCIRVCGLPDIVCPSPLLWPPTSATFALSFALPLLAAGSASLAHPVAFLPTRAVQDGGYSIQVDPISAVILIINRQNSRSWSGEGTANAEFTAQSPGAGQYQDYYHSGAYMGEKSGQKTVQADVKSSEETVQIAPALHWSMHLTFICVV